jgi:hypothetical protein
MIELFPNPQLRLRAAPPIITGAVAILVFVVKMPQASVFLACLAALGLIGLLEGLYLLLVSRSPTVVMDAQGIAVRSRIAFGRTRRISWPELRGGQTVRRQFIELATVRRRPFRIWTELVAGGPVALFTALYEMELHRAGIQLPASEPAERQRD